MKNNLKHLALICVVLSIFSCSKDEVETTEVSNVDLKDPVIEIIIADGWKAESIQKLDNGDYLLGGDIIYSSNIEDYKPLSEISERQATVGRLIDNDLSRDITVFIGFGLKSNPYYGDPNDFWENAILEAIDVWNNIEGSELKFRVINDYHTADLAIIQDFGLLPNNTIGTGEFPINGRPGDRILINLDYDGDKVVTEESKLHNMVHELGHTMGFRHTNWQERGEGQAFHVEGTPQVDPNSVMNGGTGDFNFAGLSIFDEVMCDEFY